MKISHYTVTWKDKSYTVWEEPEGGANMAYIVHMYTYFPASLESLDCPQW